MSLPSSLAHRLIFALFLFTFTPAASAQQQSPPAANPTPLKWQEFASKDGGFSVQFPDVAKVGKVPFTKGPITFTRNTHEVGLNDYFMEVDYWDIAADQQDPDLSVEGGVSGMIRALEARGGRLLAKNSVANGNCQGREAVLAIGVPGGTEGFAIGRVFSSGDRYYTLVFVSSRDDQTSRKVSQTFLNSFRVKGGCKGIKSVIAAAAPTKTTIAGTADPSTGWRRIESSQLGFSVLMPGEAQLEVQPAQTKPYPLTHYSYTHERNDSSFTLEVLSDYPPNFHNAPESMKTLMDITVYAMKRNLEPVGFVIVPLRELQLGRFPGQEFDLKLGKTGKGRAQVFVTPKRVYIAVGVVTGPTAPLSSVDRFFSSLTINP